MTTTTNVDRLQRALALAQAGRTADVRRDLVGALSLYREARALLADIEPTPLLAAVLRWEGSVMRDQGDAEQEDDDHELGFAADAAFDIVGGVADQRGDLESDLCFEL